MTGYEFAAAAIIAFYAMIGGALLGASITAPVNCQRAINIAWPIARHGFFIMWCVLLGGLAHAYYRFPYGLDLTLGPIFGLILAQCILYGLVALSRHLARLLSSER